VELAGATLVDCVHHYFCQSEQLQTAIKLSVVADVGRWRAGALMLQRLPSPADAVSEDDEDAWRRALFLMAGTSAGELCNPDLAPNDLLYRLYHEDGVRVFKPASPRAGCRCSRLRRARAAFCRRRSCAISKSTADRCLPFCHRRPASRSGAGTAALTAPEIRWAIRGPLDDDRSRRRAKILLLAAVAACSSPPKRAPFAELTYAHLPPFRLDVAVVDVIDETRPTTAAPQVAHLFPVAPATAAARWAKDRLVAVGAGGAARYTIVEASAVEAPLERTTVKGMFTSQSERYDAAIEVRLGVRSRPGSLRPRSRCAPSGQTVPEDATLSERASIRPDRKADDGPRRPARGGHPPEPGGLSALTRGDGPAQPAAARSMSRRRKATQAST
jgi:hypothetical protein